MKKVLCIGDMMLDRFVSGSVDRISPEAPVPVFRLKSVRSMLGGVGNVVANLRSLAVPVEVIARVGADAAGQEVQSLLKSIGVVSHLLLPHPSDSSLIPSNPTTVKSRYVSGHNHVLRVDEEQVAPLSPADEKRVLGLVRRALVNTSLIILSDYAKGFLSLSLCRNIIAAAKAAKVPVFVDPKGKDYRKYAGATLVKPNRKELELAIGEKVEDVEGAARRLLGALNIENAVVTLSEKGMVFVPRSGKSVRIPTEVREVFDVSGAGDTTMAALAAAYTDGASIPDAMRFANRAAGIVVGKVGTATVTRDEIAAAHAGQSKVFDSRSLAAQVRTWKAAGLTVGFTNGCFDCLHAGHIYSLEQAKRHCDKLIVAVNTDASVRRLKGPTRPIQSETTRAQVLAHLELVDAVVLFSGKTALPLVKSLRPDVLAKEGYVLEDWPEAQWLSAHGGRAITLPRLEGFSTTRMIRGMSREG